MPSGTVIFPKVGAAVATNKKRILAQRSLVDNNIMGVMVENQTVCDPEFLLAWFQSVDLREFSNPGPLPSITAAAVKNAVIHLPGLA
jgi:type I restriction enzyme, S subunit